MNIQSFTLILIASTAMLYTRANPDASTQSSQSLTTQKDESSSDKENRSVKLNNLHGIDQKVIIAQPRKDPTDCTQLHGREFMDCMACQSPENLKNNLMDCNDRMAHYYFVNLSLEEYHEALQNFTEKEWAEFYASRTAQAQQNFPSTLQDQRIMLKRIYLQAYFYHYLERLWSGQSESKTDDLEKVIRDFRARCECGYVTYATVSLLHDQFNCQRKKLFTKPAR